MDGLNGSDSDTSLSNVSSAEFEDAFPAQNFKRRKLDHSVEDDDEIDWEDAIYTQIPAAVGSAAGPSGDLELTLEKGPRIGSLTNPHNNKKGPSKIERQIRMSTHCMHVQFLLFHNLIRNRWACDEKVHSILIGQLTSDIRRAINKWKVASGISVETAARSTPPNPGSKGRKKTSRNVDNERNQRDWGKPAERQEKGEPNLSRGDPVIKLLEDLAAFWKKHFTITAPSLRKQGYKSLEHLEAEIASFTKGKYNLEEHGERVNGIEDFRNLAKTCEGSRDIGVQLFTALLRGIGLEARLIVSLQPVGFGWNRNEEASIKQKKTSKAKKHGGNGESGSDDDSSIAVVQSNRTSRLNRKIPKSNISSVKTKGRSGNKDKPINLSGDASNDDEDESSVVEITPAKPRKKTNMKHDRDIRFPMYWAEVISPITNEVYPVDPFILTQAVATNSDHIAAFEPRGPKADEAKQVLAYVVAYSSDGTAKDVTTRYLKRHMWPGRTKGVRMPIEKVPVYNKKGKIKHYEKYDWFKTVMSGYMRTHKMRSAVDDLEEAKDLKAVKPEKKEIKAGEETLQGYKNSAEFVLERHLRREEALLPGSKPVKTFVAGKGDNAKEEPVFRRKDVAVCRTSESWHKEGRQVNAGEHPIKMVPVRAVTLVRKREVEEAERDGREKLKQGLYSWEQTDWIIPPPIENGVIPKNSFGNMDCYVPSMVPKGAVHIPLRSTMKICKRLGIDYAEAVTGFEFGKQRAVPVITGVVVAAENEDLVIDEWEKDEEERRIKEDGKREKVALATWRKFLMGLRIVARVREEYGDDADAHMKEEMNPFTNKNKTKQLAADDPEPTAPVNGNSLKQNDEDMAGGFIVDDVSGGEEGGGFLPDGHNEELSHQGETDLVVTTDDEPATKQPTSYLSSSRTPHLNPQTKPNADLSNPSDTTSPPPSKSKSKRTPKSTSPKPTKHKPTRSTKTSKESTPPKRKSARTSAKAVKSLYFAQSTDEDAESGVGEDSEESATYEPVVKRGRGRPRRGGRGK